MDKLSHMINDAVEEGKWEGIKTRKRGPMITNLMFADDFLLFGRASKNQMRVIKGILDNSYSILGQKTSYKKSSIIFSKIHLIV